jgi:hypothetical protein
MKKLILVVLTSFLSSPAFAAQETISGGVGIVWGDEKTKINANFTELYGQAATKWVTGAAYTADNQMVMHDGNLYVCTSNHTAGATTEPGTGADWATVWAYSGAALYELIQTAASQAEMEAGTESGIRSMSPLRVAQAIAALGGSGSDELVYQADCSLITDGFCIDTDNGSLWYYDGDSVEQIGASAGDDLGSASATDVAALFSGDGAYLRSDGSTGDPSGSGLTGLVDDLTPQLGGDLDLNTHDITGTGNVNISGTISASGGFSSSSSAPEMGLRDSDAEGSTSDDEYAGGIGANLTTTTEGAEVSDVTVYYMDGGVKTAAIVVGGSENQISFQKPTAFQAGDIVGTEIGNDQIGSQHYEDASVGLSHLSFGLTYDIVVEAPTDDDSFLFAKAPNALSISDIHCIVTGGTSVVIDVQECDGAGANCASVDATITCDADGAEDDGTLSNSAIDAGDWLKLDIGTVTGEVSQVAVSIYY